jgi:adenine-specific DNA-methyltransferase
MSATHICERCGKTFKFKSQLTTHLNRKYPCKKPETVKENTESRGEDLENIRIADTSEPNNKENASDIPTEHPNISNAHEFHDSSRLLTKNIPLVERKKQGIYFTPKQSRDRLIQIIAEHHNPSRILEPSFGSGEFLRDCSTRWPDANITGVEQNKQIYDHVYSEISGMTIHNMDFLMFPKENTYDTIIGNPPFFVMNPAPTEEPVVSLYTESSSGRCNIFVLFMYKCLRYHLSPGGILGFILPTSIYNSSYYDKCRNYIYRECSILHTERQSSKFMDTDQNTCILVIQKIKKDDRYIIPIHRVSLILPEYQMIHKILSKPHTSIAKLGANVQTGTIVWNQVKQNLTDEESSFTAPLIYDHSITDTGIDFSIQSKNVLKKKFVKISMVSSRPTDSEIIVMRRGYGNKFMFKYAMAPIGVYCENHINMINGSPDVLKQIYTSFKDIDTQTFGKIVFSNGSISKTELEHVLPIFVAPI